LISEKTVELNMTAELLAWLRWTTGIAHVAVGPSLTQEGRLGFDAGYLGGGTGILIQYKRAYVAGNVWSWKLNRTQSKDQHDKLQKLEAKGWPVFYAFPLFATLQEVLSRRRRLLVSTAWYRPSIINLPGGPIGHHDVNFDRVTQRWWVTSTPLDLPHPLTIADVAEALDRSVLGPRNLEEMVAALNGLFESDYTASGRPDAASADDDFSAMSLVVRTQQT
jgi:hypothetical protein